MKTIGTLLISLFLCSNLASAQDTLYVYKAGAVVYKSVITDIDSVSFTYIAPEINPVSDIDGNIYPVVTIGTQTWMAENLKVTHYRNGESINNITDNTAWSAANTSAWCDYENETANGPLYGKLYNWYAVADNRKIAPVGWHVATDAEWTTLYDYIFNHLGTSLNVAKAIAATTLWDPFTKVGSIGLNLSENNKSGFSALPGGYRLTSGSFLAINRLGYWWSSSEALTTNAWSRDLGYDCILVSRGNKPKVSGFSVRCVRDE